MLGAHGAGIGGAAADLYLGKDIRSAAIIGNHFCARKARIINEAHKRKQVQILGNVTD